MPVATAPIGPLAWESPYAVGAAQEIAKRPKKKKRHCIEITDESKLLWKSKARIFGILTKEKWFGDKSTEN